MKLNHPFTISSRLMPALTVANAVIQLEYSKNQWDRKGRTVYSWVIDIKDESGNEKSFNGSDLRSGCGGGSLFEGFQSLLSFLGAAGESFAYAERHGRDGMDGENADLFPRELVEWAAQNSDEITFLSIELDCSDGIEE